MLSAGGRGGVVQGICLSQRSPCDEYVFREHAKRPLDDLVNLLALEQLLGSESTTDSCVLACALRGTLPKLNDSA